MADFDPFTSGEAKESAVSGKEEFDPFKGGNATPSAPDAKIDDMHDHIQGHLKEIYGPDIHESKLGGVLPNTPYTGMGYQETLKGRAKEGLDEIIAGAKRVYGRDVPLGQPRLPTEIPAGVAGVAGGLAKVIGSPLYAGENVTEKYTGLPAGSVESAIGGAGAKGGLGIVKTPPVGPFARPPEAISGLANRAGGIRDPNALPSGITPDVINARNQASQFGVDLPLPAASGDKSGLQFLEDAAKGQYGKKAEAMAIEAKQRLGDQIKSSGQGLIKELTGSEPVDPNTAAAGINADVGQAAERARAGIAAVHKSAEDEASRIRELIGQQGEDLATQIRAGNPEIQSAAQGGATIGAAVRERAAVDRAAFKDRYNKLDAMEGQFEGTSFNGTGDRLRKTLEDRDEPVMVDSEATKQAHGAVNYLNNNPRLKTRIVPGSDPKNPQYLPVDIRDVLTARKGLVSFYNNARDEAKSSGKYADLRATTSLIDEYDNHIENSISNGLFSGDPRVLGALKDANASYRSYAQTYRPQYGADAVGQAMRRIVDRNATPEKIADMVTDIGTFGKELPVHIMDRLEKVLGPDSEAYNAIKQSVLLRTQAPGDTAKSAKNMLNLTGSTLGKRVFTPEELNGIRNQAVGMRDLDQTIENLASAKGAKTIDESYQRTFGGQIGGTPQTALRRIVSGEAKPDETANAIFNVVKNSGNQGNIMRFIDAVKNIAGPDSEAMTQIKQGVLQRLLEDKEAQGLASSVEKFTKTDIGKHLFTPAQLSRLEQWRQVVNSTVTEKGMRNPPGTAAAVMRGASSWGNALAWILGEGVGMATHSVLKGAGTAATAMAIGYFRNIKNADKVAHYINWQDRL